MTVEVKRQNKESVLSLVNRFTRKVQLSGVIRVAREKMFREKPKSEQLKKWAALRRERMKEMYEKLDKLGLLKK